MEVVNTSGMKIAHYGLQPVLVENAGRMRHQG